MIKLNKIFLVILYFIIFSGCAVSQQSRSADGSNSSLTVKRIPDFVSREGGFTIALSSVSYESNPYKFGQGYINGGTQYKWNSTTGFFSITYGDLIECPKDAKEFIKFSSDLFIKEIISEGGKLVSTQELSLDGNPGMEGRLLLKQGSVGLYRYYIVKNRVYSIISGWKENENGEYQMRMLDSFKLLTSHN
jgi:hypothetical protein